MILGLFCASVDSFAKLVVIGLRDKWVVKRVIISRWIKV